ncbi:transposase [Streptomyces sp. MZ04]|uniref:transposase n=1 Tax=Streptomyces sp. MZ04 TaxID=2559236 RepID=UPI00107E9FD1|nr:transposase [Streptomyces sp. MZ04]TGB16078.1 transposase [Streptomyces sp. MZ04]
MPPALTGPVCDGALTPDLGYRRDLDPDGLGERSPRGDEALSRRVQGGRGRVVRSRPGATIKSVAADLGVSTETLRNWIRAADGRSPGADSTFPAAAPTPDSAEVAALRKRVRELEEERDILCKAARYFVGETRW